MAYMRRVGIHFTRHELIDLLKSMGAIGLAFAVMQMGITAIATVGFYQVLGIALITVGIGFLLHELAHKLIAQHYGCIATYKADNRMLIFTLILSLLGLLFAAPGAVYIQGAISKRQNGIISAAGPATNLALALLFLILALLGTGIWQGIAIVGLSINAWLALFNMIPFGPFDGAKIMKWNKVVFAVMIAIGIALQLFVYII